MVAVPLTLSRGASTLTIHGGGNGWSVKRGVQGLDSALADLVEVSDAGLDGSTYAGLDVPARDVILPLRASAPTLSALEAMRQALRDITNPRLGPVRLTVTSPAGDRWIEGYRVLRTDTAWDASTWSSAGWARVGLMMRCPDPYWRAADVTASLASATPGLWFPVTPVVLKDVSSVARTTTVNVGGDAYTYPRWTLTGPCSSLKATHVASGRSWTLNLTLAAGQSAVVTTDPRRTGYAVTGPDGTSAFSALAAPYDLWPLPPGAQAVSMLMLGTAAGASVSMAATPRWEAALGAAA